MDNQVFEDIRAGFRRADEDENVKVVIFDSAPIKTFIAGASVPDFVKNIKLGNFKEIVKDTAFWQDVLFHDMTSKGKPKIAIVDGTASGGGVENKLTERRTRPRSSRQRLH